MIPGNMTMTTVDVTIATTPDIDTTGNGVAPTVASNLPVIASVSLVIISMVLVGLICAFVLILSCLHHRKRLEKRYHIIFVSLVIPRVCNKRRKKVLLVYCRVW